MDTFFIFCKYFTPIKSLTAAYLLPVILFSFYFLIGHFALYITLHFSCVFFQSLLICIV